MDDLIIMMSALLGNEPVVVPHETIIILGEIQDCPKARTAMKPLNFEEFLWANGIGEHVIHTLKKCLENATVPEALHNKCRS